MLPNHDHDREARVVRCDNGREARVDRCDHGNEPMALASDGQAHPPAGRHPDLVQHQHLHGPGVGSALHHAGPRHAPGLVHRLPGLAAGLRPLAGRQPLGQPHVRPGGRLLAALQDSHPPKLGHQPPSVLPGDGGEEELHHRRQVRLAPPPKAPHHRAAHLHTVGSLLLKRLNTGFNTSPGP